MAHLEEESPFELWVDTFFTPWMAENFYNKLSSQNPEILKDIAQLLIYTNERDKAELSPSITEKQSNKKDKKIKELTEQIQDLDIKLTTIYDIDDSQMNEFLEYLATNQNAETLIDKIIANHGPVALEKKEVKGKVKKVLNV